MKLPVLAREAGQLRVDAVPSLLIERASLEVECVQPCLPATRLPSSPLCLVEEGGPVSAPACRFFHPQRVHLQPIPYKRAEEPGDQPTIDMNRKPQRAIIPRRGMLVTEPDEFLLDALLVSIREPVVYRE
ncbi:MAG TPA: hypothetical protein VFG50_17645 [Rhodothermales bacterium]|nr:hypothetical protein [Rhodothermales bacterium]